MNPLDKVIMLHPPLNATGSPRIPGAGDFSRRFLHCVAAIISILFQVSAQDTLSRELISDTAAKALQHIDSLKAPDSLKTVDTIRVPAPIKAADSTNDTLKTGMSFDSCMIIGAGIGLSVGSIPLFSLWKKGLPQSLAAFGISGSFLSQPSDSETLLFSLKENPDIYNMVFPLSISFDRCYSQSRFGTALSFSMISKKYAASFATSVDTARRIDISHQLELYTLTLDLLYGRKIPVRYFSVDGVDRTDAILGISFAPLLALKKSASVKSQSANPRFSAIADSLANGTGSFLSYGLAFGWRAGIMTLRKLSNQGGIEAGISYFGVWSSRFRTGGVPLLENQLRANNTDMKEISTLSHRIELSLSLVRKVFSDHDGGPRKQGVR